VSTPTSSLHTIQSLHDTSTLTRGDLVRLVERGIENGATHDVVTSAGVGSVTVQTIHSAKGLEYPIVVLANMNAGKFPPNVGGSSAVQYEEPVGLRQRKLYADVEEHAHPHVYDNWTHDVLRHCLNDDNDEERRLLYVAVTRAENHVVFAGGEKPNTFYEGLSFEGTHLDPAVEQVDRARRSRPSSRSRSSPEGPTGHTPHTLMDDAVFEDAAVELETEGLDGVPRSGLRLPRPRFRGGLRARREDVSPTTDGHDDQRNVKAFIDGLSGELHVEERAVLPLDVDGEAGDGLRHRRPGPRDGEPYRDYRLQDRSEQTRRIGLPETAERLLPCHQRVVPGKKVEATLFYTATNERRTVEPLSWRNSGRRPCFVVVGDGSRSFWLAPIPG